MALSGPVLVVADEANEVCEALTRGGNLTMREVAPADAVAAIGKTKPSSVVLAGCPPEFARPVAAKLARLDGPLVPMLAIAQDSDAPAFANALPIPAEDVPTRLVPRLRAALRVRALHATVLRRFFTHVMGCAFTGRGAAPCLTRVLSNSWPASSAKAAIRAA